MADDYTPRYVGDLANPLTVSFTDHSGVAYNLTGLSSSDFTFILVSFDGSTTITCGGTWTIISPPSSGVAQYAWITSDVVTPGKFRIKIKANIGGSGRPLSFDPKTIEFLA